MTKRISFCSNETFERLLTAAANRQELNRSLFIRSAIISFIEKNHRDLLEAIQ